MNSKQPWRPFVPEAFARPPQQPRSTSLMSGPRVADALQAVQSPHHDAAAAPKTFSLPPSRRIDHDSDMMMTDAMSSSRTDNCEPPVTPNDNSSNNNNNKLFRSLRSFRQTSHRSTATLWSIGTHATHSTTGGTELAFINSNNNGKMASQRSLGSCCSSTAPPPYIRGGRLRPTPLGGEGSITSASSSMMMTNHHPRPTRSARRPDDPLAQTFLQRATSTSTAGTHQSPAPATGDSMAMSPPAPAILRRTLFK